MNVTDAVMSWAMMRDNGGWGCNTDSSLLVRICQTCKGYQITMIGAVVAV